MADPASAAEPPGPRHPSQRNWLVAAVMGVVALGLLGALLWPDLAQMWKAQVQRDWYQRARGYAAEGDTLEALRCFARAESVGLKTPEFFDRYGRIELLTFRGVSAESHFIRALAIDSSYGPARANLALLYLRRGWYAQSAQEYALAAAALPDSAAPLYAMAGSLYEGMKSHDRALTMYRASLHARRGYLPALEGMLRLGEPLPGKNR